MARFLTNPMCFSHSCYTNLCYVQLIFPDFATLIIVSEKQQTQPPIQRPCKSVNKNSLLYSISIYRHPRYAVTVAPYRDLAVHLFSSPNTVMCRLTTGIRSEKCVFRRFRLCSNIRECTYTNLDSIAYYTPRPYGVAYCSQATNPYSMID